MLKLCSKPFKPLSGKHHQKMSHQQCGLWQTFIQQMEHWFKLYHDSEWLCTQHRTEEILENWSTHFTV